MIFTEKFFHVKRSKYNFKYLFYLIYPLHIFIIYLIKLNLVGFE